MIVNVAVVVRSLPKEDPGEPAPASLTVIGYDPAVAPVAFTVSAPVVELMVTVGSGCGGPHAPAVPGSGML